MKHIKKQTHIKPLQAVTVDVILTIIVQMLSAVRTLLETKDTTEETE